MLDYAGLCWTCWTGLGFKLLIDSKQDELIAAAEKSIVDNHCDIVVANDLADIKSNNHRVHLVWPNKPPETFEGNHLAAYVAEESYNLLWEGPK